MPLNPSHAATLAIRARDADALATAFPDFESAAAYRTHTLPLLRADECRWFWQQIMSPEQYNQTLELCMKSCRTLLSTFGFRQGQHYDWILQNNVCLLIAHTDAIATILFDRIPQERHSILRCFFYEEP